MKVTIYELLGLIKDGKAPEVIKYDGLVYYKEIDGYYTTNELKLKLSIMNNLNDEVEIIEEKKKFTKEDFINERMKIDKITRKEFDEMYEVKECNCGMPYCKGFIVVYKEEPQEHKIPEKMNEILGFDDLIPPVDENMYKIWEQTIKNHNKINEILDYLEEIE